MLVGPIVGQTALHGATIRIRDIGLPFLSVRRVAEAYGGSHRECSDECATDPRREPWRS